MKKDERPRKKNEKEQYTLRLTESSRMMVGGRDKREKRVGPNAWYYLGFVGEIGYSISLPIAGGALLGTYIDRHWLTYPKATLSLILVGSVISVLGFIRVIREIINRKN